jgi:phospholipase C
MMENRSFDHMLGSLKAMNPQIDGVDGTHTIANVNNSLLRGSARPSLF